MPEPQPTGRMLSAEDLARLGGPAVEPLTPKERSAWTLALPGTSEGARTRRDIAARHGGERAVERARDPVGAWIGENVMPQLPYVLLGAIPGAGWAPIAARIAGAGIIGAAERQPREAIIGQAVGEAIGLPAGIVTKALQRVGGGAYRWLADRMADQLVAAAKRAVPGWRDVPEGQAGIKAILGPEGTGILAAIRRNRLKRYGGWQEWAKESPETLRAHNEGRAFVQALQRLKAWTGERVDPEALVKGYARATGRNAETVWDRLLSAAHAPAMRSALDRLLKGYETTPALHRLPHPYLGAHAGTAVGATLGYAAGGVPGAAAGGALGYPLGALGMHGFQWTTGVPYTAGERSVQELARRAVPVLAGSVAREAQAEGEDDGRAR